MQSVLCLHARVNVCSWIRQGIWCLQRLSSHKCYHLQKNLLVWSFLIDDLHSAKTYLRTSHSWLSCNGKINHFIKSAIWCLGDFDVLHRDKKWVAEYSWILLSWLKSSFWNNFLGFCWNDKKEKKKKKQSFWKSQEQTLNLYLSS